MIEKSIKNQIFLNDIRLIYQKLKIGIIANINNTICDNTKIHKSIYQIDIFFQNYSIDSKNSLFFKHLNRDITDSIGINIIEYRKILEFCSKQIKLSKTKRFGFLFMKN